MHANFSWRRELVKNTQQMQQVNAAILTDRAASLWITASKWKPCVPLMNAASSLTRIHDMHLGLASCQTLSEFYLHVSVKGRACWPPTQFFMLLIRVWLRLALQIPSESESCSKRLVKVHQIAQPLRNKLNNGDHAANCAVTRKGNERWNCLMTEHNTK